MGAWILWISPLAQTWEGVCAGASSVAVHLHGIWSQCQFSPHQADDMHHKLYRVHPSTRRPPGFGRSMSDRLALVAVWPSISLQRSRANMWCDDSPPSMLKSLHAQQTPLWLKLLLMLQVKMGAAGAERESSVNGPVGHRSGGSFRGAAVWQLDGRPPEPAAFTAGCSRPGSHRLGQSLTHSIIGVQAVWGRGWLPAVIVVVTRMSLLHCIWSCVWCWIPLTIRCVIAVADREANLEIFCEDLSFKTLPLEALCLWIGHILQMLACSTPWYLCWSRLAASWGWSFLQWWCHWRQRCIWSSISRPIICDVGSTGTSPGLQPGQGWKAAAACICASCLRLFHWRSCGTR